MIKRAERRGGRRADEKTQTIFPNVFRGGFFLNFFLFVVFRRRTMARYVEILSDLRGVVKEFWVIYYFFGDFGFY